MINVYSTWHQKLQKVKHTVRPLIGGRSEFYCIYFSPIDIRFRTLVLQAMKNLSMLIFFDNLVEFVHRIILARVTHVHVSHFSTSYAKYFAKNRIKIRPSEVEI